MAEGAVTLHSPVVPVVSPAARLEAFPAEAAGDTRLLPAVIPADRSTAVHADIREATRMGGRGIADITAEWVVPDPQKVPEWITERLHAVKPEELLGAPFWPRLARARNRRVGRSRGYGRLREQLAAITG